MHFGILVAVIVYEIVTILGVGIVIARAQRRRAQTEGFALAGRTLGTTHVGVTLALTMLGSAHIWGTTENAYGMGSTAIWFGIACVVMMVVISQCTGPWIRRIGTSTVPDLFGRLYGKKPRLLVACVMAPLVFGCLCLETQCIAVTFVALTGWSYQAGAIVGGIFGILYVTLAGMKEVSWLNIINAVVMYIGMIVAFVALFFYLPEGWQGVERGLVESGNGWMRSIFGNPDLIVGFAIPSILCCTLFQGISQMGLQTAISAKDARTVKKSLWLAGGINGCFCIIPAFIGMAALVFDMKGTLSGDGSPIGAMFSSPALIVQLLPSWVVFLIMASFLGALLSTFAMTALCPATIFAHDLYAGLLKKDATEQERTRVMRIVIIVVGIIAIGLSNFQPQVVSTINWIFTWAFPIFVMTVIGLFWKRSTVAAVVTMFAAWVANIVWTTFGLQAALHAEIVHGAYIAIAISLVVGIALTGALPGKKGYFRENALEARAIA
ncbi:MAG: sodium:solute symporter family protein [Clostridiales Family XIII bacterium]|jgi:SSS family solute:Na+ symporter|nr:sodium:solute symporter family protein [Clostridiales Family XIII bacterium]